MDAIKLNSLLEYYLGTLGILYTQVDAIKLSSLLEYWLGTLAKCPLLKWLGTLAEYSLNINAKKEDNRSRWKNHSIY